MPTDHRDRFVADVVVTLKPVVNDPQGEVVREALHTLGFAEVSGVRVGRYLAVEVVADEVTARARVDAMCQELLCNGVIEEYRFTLRAADRSLPAPS
ncbi:MAG TPA: phosphoribosylformylglycinamidine synthase subunit PurS [Candidatus Dormibacteraeota bacterium]|nr:phosphoribosylformylglycinamidine synthase subunit PurS [Candidatus Dormibacteraeota bacterium]